MAPISNSIVQALVGFVFFGLIGKALNRDRPQMNWAAWLAGYYFLALANQSVKPLLAGDYIAVGSLVGGWLIPLILALDEADTWRTQHSAKPKSNASTDEFGLVDGSQTAAFEQSKSNVAASSTYPILGEVRHRPSFAPEVPCEGIPAATKQAGRTGIYGLIAGSLSLLVFGPLLLGGVVAFGFGLYFAAIQSLALAGLIVVLVSLLVFLFFDGRRTRWRTLQVGEGGLLLQGRAEERRIPFDAIQEVQTYLDEAEDQPARRGLVLIIEEALGPLVLELGDNTPAVAGLLCGSTGLTARHTRAKWQPQEPL